MRQTFFDGEPLTAAQVQQIQDEAVINVANTTERDELPTSVKTAWVAGSLQKRTAGGDWETMPTVDQVQMAMPIGSIIMWSGAAAPNGWHLCDGSAHGSTALAALIGANTPNLRDRFIVGAGSAYNVGNTGGASTVTLTAAQSGVPAHNHSASSAGETQEHTHSGTSGYMNQNNVHNHGTDAQGSHSHNVFTNEGSDQTGNDGQMIDTVPSWQSTYPQTGHTDAQGSHGHNITNTDINHTHSFTTGGRSAQHSHGITVNNNSAANATEAHENKPPYYALTFIIRKS